MLRALNFNDGVQSYDARSSKHVVGYNVESLGPEAIFASGLLHTQYRKEGKEHLPVMYSTLAVDAQVVNRVVFQVSQGFWHSSSGIPNCVSTGVRRVVLVHISKCVNIFSSFEC